MGRVPEDKAQDFSEKKYLYFMPADTELDGRGYIGIFNFTFTILYCLRSPHLHTNKPL